MNQPTDDEPYEPTGPTGRTTSVAGGCLVAAAAILLGSAGCSGEPPGRSFTDVTRSAGIDFRYSLGDSTYDNIIESSGSGIAVFDYDGDGRLDLYFLNGTHLEGVSDPSGGRFRGARNSLYRNLGDGTFRDTTARSGLAGAFAGKAAWGAALLDYDRDGDLDVFSANGAAEELLPQSPLLLENDGTGNFRSVGPDGGAYFRGLHSGRGAVVVDYDDDGDLDLAVSHVGVAAPPALLRNDGVEGAHWLGISLESREAPAAAPGARVTVVAGSTRRVAVSRRATSYLSSNDPRIHVGLGSHERVDRLEIRWVDRNVEVVTDVPVDRYVTVVQGRGIRR